MSLLLTLLRTENEDNAILCMKVIIDLHRTYSRPPPASQNSDQPDQTFAKIAASVDEFLETVAELFRGMGPVVEDTFSTKGGAGEKDMPSPAAAAAPPAIEPDGAAGGAAVVYAPAMKSFKLLQDCPAAIVFIFQTYRQLVDKAITIFVPLVFDVSWPEIARDERRADCCDSRLRSSCNCKLHRKRRSTPRWSPASRGSVQRRRSPRPSVERSRTW
jgi:transformation/transcription domain-associated protein